MRKAALKSILIGIVLVANEQFSGTFVLLFGISRVFQRNGATSPTPEISTIIVGVIQLIGSASANLLIDRWGRKPLLIFGTCSVAVGLCVFGIATQLMEHVETSTFVKTIPVIALSWVVFVANVGVFPLTFVILSEISPENVSATNLFYINKLTFHAPIGQRRHFLPLHVLFMDFLVLGLPNANFSD